MSKITISLPFAIGQQLWWTGSAHQEDWIECPECCGTKVIEMIKGNGEHISIDCDMCARGYEPPRGVIKRIEYRYEPTPFMPRRVRCDGNEFTYSESPPDSNAYGSVDSKHLFATRHECQVECDKMNVAHAVDVEEGIARSIKQSRRKVAFSSQYWSAQIKRLEEQLSVAKARLSKVKQSRKSA